METAAESTARAFSGDVGKRERKELIYMCIVGVDLDLDLVVIIGSIPVSRERGVGIGVVDRHYIEIDWPGETFGAKQGGKE